MSVNWNAYTSSLMPDGETRRERVITQTKRNILTRAKRSPAYKRVLIDGKERNVTITSAQEYFQKKIGSLPDEQIYAGSIVEWNDTHYIIMYVDSEDEIYQRGLMYECNVFFKWQNEEGLILSTWGYSENLSMYAAGVVAAKVLQGIEQNFLINVPLNVDTLQLQRDKRFLIDVTHDDPSAYILTNHNSISLNFNPQIIDKDNPKEEPYGVMLLTMQLTQRSEKDNCELMIADYFEPKDNKPLNEKCDIKYSGKPEIKAGGSYKKFTAVFTDSNGNVLDTDVTWTVTIVPELEQYFDIVYENNAVKIKTWNVDMVGTIINIQASNSDNSVSAEMYVKVVSLYG